MTAKKMTKKKAATKKMNGGNLGTLLKKRCAMLVDKNKGLVEENQRLMAMFATCMVAVRDGSEEHEVKVDVYGWSPTYAEVLKLRREHDQLRKSHDQVVTEGVEKATGLIDANQKLTKFKRGLGLVRDLLTHMLDEPTKGSLFGIPSALLIGALCIGGFIAARGLGGA